MASRIVYDCTVSATSAERESMARKIAAIVQAGEKSEAPFPAVAGDDFRWQLGRSEAWILQFFPEEPCVLRIEHWLNNIALADALQRWVAFRTFGTLVDSQGVPLMAGLPVAG